MSRTKGKRFAEKKINKADSLKRKNRKIYNLIIFLCVCVIIYSLYNIVIWAIENKKNNDILNDIQSVAGITHEEVTINNQPVVKAHYDFTELLNRNPNTVGWVYVPNSKIDYPVVQWTDNDYYLNHSFNNSENSAGWVFADSSCDVLNSKNVVIYGHNRKDSSMFGSLKRVYDDDWISNPENNYITFANLNETDIYKIFSVFIANDESVASYLETDFSTDEAFRSYLTRIKNTSSQKFDTDIENTDKIITLYTCYGMNNQRLLVFAAKVD
ncbi:MAG: class B sortase [Clostridia bacterium]|nr:class B sortase [Clostridia bacterium]